MTDNMINFIQCEPAALQQIVNAFGNCFNSKTKNTCAIHLNIIIRITCSGALNFQTAPCTQNGSVGRIRYNFNDGSAAAIAKEHTSAAICHIKKSGQLFHTDNKAIGCRFVQETPRCFQCIDEATAGSIDIHDGNILGKSERLLNKARNTWCRIISGNRCTNTAADLLGSKAGTCKRQLCCLNSQTGTVFLFFTKKSGMNTGARIDPLITCIDC